MTGVQSFVFFLSCLVLVSLLGWFVVGPTTCWFETRIQWIPAYQQSWWINVEREAVSKESTMLRSEAHTAVGAENVKCNPKQKVIFAKTHKTGGTSVQVRLLSRYLHNQSEYPVQNCGRMGPTLCAAAWTSSSLFPSLHLLSVRHGTDLW